MTRGSNRLGRRIMKSHGGCVSSGSGENWWLGRCHRAENYPDTFSLVLGYFPHSDTLVL